MRPGRVDQAARLVVRIRGFRIVGGCVDGLYVDAHRLVRTRFALSRVAEMTNALEVLAHPARAPYAHRWVASVAGRLDRSDFDVLLAIAEHASRYVPDLAQGHRPFSPRPRRATRRRGSSQPPTAQDTRMADTCRRFAQRLATGSRLRCDDRSIRPLLSHQLLYTLPRHLTQLAGPAPLDPPDGMVGGSFPSTGAAVDVDGQRRLGDMVATVWCLWARPRAIICPTTITMPVFDARRWTRMGSVDASARADGAAPRSLPISARAQRVRPYPNSSRVAGSKNFNVV